MKCYCRDVLMRADFCLGTGLLNNNNNNNNNNMASPGPSGNKLGEMLRAGGQPGAAQQYHDEMQSQQQRMAAAMAAVSAGEFTHIDISNIIRESLLEHFRKRIDSVFLKIMPIPVHLCREINTRRLLPIAGNVERRNLAAASVRSTATQ